MYSKEHEQIINQVLQAAELSASEVHLPEPSQFQSDGKFSVRKPRLTPKLYYFGFCVKKCGVAIKSIDTMACIACKKAKEFDTSKATWEESQEGVRMKPKVYAIRQKSTGKVIYVGLTERRIEVRESAHYSSSKVDMRKNLYAYVRANGGWDSFFFEVLYESCVLLEDSTEKQDMEIRLMYVFEQWYISYFEGLTNVDIKGMGDYIDKYDLVERVGKEQTYRKMILDELEFDQKTRTQDMERSWS